MSLLIFVRRWGDKFCCWKSLFFCFTSKQYSLTHLLTYLFTRRRLILGKARCRPPWNIADAWPTSRRCSPQDGDGTPKNHQLYTAWYYVFCYSSSGDEIIWYVQ